MRRATRHVLPDPSLSSGEPRRFSFSHGVRTPPLWPMDLEADAALIHRAAAPRRRMRYLINRSNRDFK
jgi:hypothetical protein